MLNGIEYLELCIQSILNQGYPNIEQIFVDGGSTDGTLELLADYQVKYPRRIKYITGKDKGVGDALNKGFKTAGGDIYGWLDADDIYEPDAIMAVVDFFRANPDAYFVFGESDVINENGEVIRKRLVKDFDLKEATNDRHYIVICAAFYKREVVEKVGGFNDLGNDLDFWLRVAQEFKLYRIDKMISHWRLHQGGITMSSSERNRQTDRRRFREDYLLCRQYGGSIFSARCRRYFIFSILDRLQLYPFVNFKVLPILRRYPWMNKVLKILGA